MTLCLSNGPSLPPGDGQLTCSHQFQGPPGGDAKGFYLVAYGDISKLECPPMFRDTHMYIYIYMYFYIHICLYLKYMIENITSIFKHLCINIYIYMYIYTIFA